MTTFEAIILGVIQGATEFLPISSSGHLLLVPSLFNMAEPDLNAIAIAHQGTLLAILVYFRRDLWHITKAVIAGLRLRQPLATFDARLGWYIVAGSIPAVIAGLLAGDLIDSIIDNPMTVAFLLIGTAIILIIGERLYTGRKALAEMGWADAISVGFFQVLALLPGISRSGVTMSTGMGRGFDRSSAARFSFLLGVPAIAGAGILSVIDLAQSPTSLDQLPTLFLTFLASFFVGYFCIFFLLSWLRRGTLYPFAAYCGAFGVIYLLINWLS